MKSRRTSRPFLVWSAAILGAVSEVSGQSPLRGEFRVNTFVQRFQVEPAVAYGPSGEFLIAWASYLDPTPGGGSNGRAGLLARGYAANGAPAGPPFLVSEDRGETTPLLIASPEGRFLIVWYSISELSTFSRLYTEGPEPDGPGALIAGGPGTQQAAGGLCALPDGRFAVLTSSIEHASQSQQILVVPLAADGTALGSSVTLAEGHVETNSLFAADLAADQSGSDVLAVWGGDGGDGSGDSVWGRFLGGSLNPLGDAFLINTFTNGHQGPASAASTGNGEFVVVWQSENQDGSLEGIYGQRLSVAEGKVGPEFRVNTQTFSAQRSPSVAADLHGNFVVIWLSVAPGGWDVRGQLYRWTGTPVGSEFRLNTQPLQDSYSRPRVAFGPKGTFVAVWESWDFVDGHSWDISAQRFAASPADEPCLVREGVFLCDTGRTGAEAELAIRFANRTGDVPLIGDFDGDGRAEPCAFRNGRLRCDLDHRGGLAEDSLDLRGVTKSADVPSFGDVSGDGRADLCLRRGNRWHCNTSRRPDTVDLVLSFGLSSDDALMGDVDGDGHADLCVVRGGAFRCDTGRDGGAAEVLIAFGQPGDRALLGDFDGDGRDDPCVLHGTQFLCDTAHDGGAAEGSLSLFSAAGDVPLLANLDGL